MKYTFPEFRVLNVCVCTYVYMQMGPWTPVLVIKVLLLMIQGLTNTNGTMDKCADFQGVYIALRYKFSLGTFIP